MIQLPAQSFSVLPQNHDVRHLVRQVVYLTLESVDRARTPLVFSQKIVQLLYKTPTQLGREVYVTLLDQLCRTYEDVAKEAISWLLYAEDEVRFFLFSNCSSLIARAAQTQCSCYGHPSFERTAKHHVARPTASQVSLCGRTAESSLVCDKPDQAVSLD